MSIMSPDKQRDDATQPLSAFD